MTSRLKDEMIYKYEFYFLLLEPFPLKFALQ